MKQNYERKYRALNTTVLLLPFEFTTWKRASHWTYAIQLGLEEGFTSNNVDFFTIPVFEGIPSSSPESWLYYARQFCSILALGERYCPDSCGIFSGINRIQHAGI